MSKWSDWDKVPDGDHRGCQARIYVDLDGGWIHYLLAPPDEPDPDNNHVHIKYYNSVASTPVLCGITEDGKKSHSRKRLLDRINSVTGLELEYK